MTLSISQTSGWQREIFHPRDPRCDHGVFGTGVFVRIFVSVFNILHSKGLMRVQYCPPASTMNLPQANTYEIRHFSPFHSPLSLPPRGCIAGRLVNEEKLEEDGTRIVDEGMLEPDLRLATGPCAHKTTDRSSQCDDRCSFHSAI